MSNLFSNFENQKAATKSDSKFKLDRSAISERSRVSRALEEEEGKEEEEEEK